LVIEIQRPFQKTFHYFYLKGWIISALMKLLSLIVFLTATIQLSAQCDALIINDLPIVSFEPVSEGIICLNHPSYELNAEPSGGDFSGFGVSGTTFSPGSAGEGSHWLYYAYEDDNSCTGVDSTMVTVSACLGLNELEKNGAMVFPNPFSDYATITFVASLTENHTIVICDILGQEVYRNENVIGVNLEIEKELLGVGVYVLSLFNSDSKKLFTTKLLVE
jgi:hypothetical protein